MSIIANSVMNRESHSRKAGQKAAQELRHAFGANAIRGVLVYASVAHDSDALLAAIEAELPGVALCGSSTAGLMWSGGFAEEYGYLVGMIGFGGEGLSIATASALKYQEDSQIKAQELASKLRNGVLSPPKLVILFGDPLAGADLESFARTIETELSCPVIGGGSGQPWGAMVETYQFSGAQAHSHSATALVLAGDFSVAIATTTGTQPTMASSTVTKSEANVILELDGRPALDVYATFVGVNPLTELTNEINSRIALGFELSVQEQAADSLSPYVVRGPFGLDLARKGLVMGASAPEGTRVVLHRRSVQTTLEGAEQTARALLARLEGRTPKAVLGFECAARTAPLLGAQVSRQEQEVVQNILGRGAAWLGMLAWGELAPYGGCTTYFNYTYPIAVLTD